MRSKQILVVLVIMAFANVACYNKYFISKTELEKLEASVEHREAVAVIIDGCDLKAGASSGLEVDRAPRVAQDETTATDSEPAASPAEEEEEWTPPEEEAAASPEVTPEEPAVVETADAAAETPASPASKADEFPEVDPKTGCPMAVVNTASPLNVLTKDGAKHRVTPFNFAVTESQVVSPDYDLLLGISEVDGAEIQTFSGWKTTALLSGVVLLTAGSFVAISVLAKPERGLGQ